MKAFFFHVFRMFKPKDLLTQAKEKIENLEQERFYAILTKIQWECQVHSKNRQIDWLQAFIKDNNATNK